MSPTRIASLPAATQAAARLLGLLGPSGELAAPAGPPIVGLGVDGRPTPLPTTQVAFTFAGVFVVAVLR